MLEKRRMASKKPTPNTVVNNRKDRDGLPP
jgi:hypothetical protein